VKFSVAKFIFRVLEVTNNNSWVFTYYLGIAEKVVKKQQKN
jgi:hypothetical protein